MIDGESLLADCQRLVRELVDDLRTRTEEVPEIKELIRGEFSSAQSAQRTAKSYTEWLEDQLAQVAVGWVLTSVFVRFCEDNGLDNEPLLSGPGRNRQLARDARAAWLAQRPAAGDRAWLTEVFDRYQSVLVTADLFGNRNPLRLFGPSDDGARAILELWWKLDDDGQLAHEFTDPDWDTRFLGDLYQDLSDHAKKNYALLQTPDFVEEFILDRTLTPAIDTFGLDTVRVIDPACGSGHFPLGAFDRLLELWRDREPATPVRALCQRVFDGVAGVDANPFAVSIARFRLIVAAMRASGVTRLADAPGWDLNIAVADSLLHGKREQRLLGGLEELPAATRHRYRTEDSELADELLQPGQYHAVVGNPPYITVKDAALSAAYRELYTTTHRQYSLAVPFTERFFELTAPGSSRAPSGYVGMITANSFMKREFGKKLIEEYFASEVDLTHVIDTSGAYIPGHGTPTVILFGRNQRPTEEPVRSVLGIRGEPGAPEVPSEGLVWTAITEQVDQPASESEYVSVEDIERSRFGSHPWSLQGGAAPDMLQRLMQSTGGSLENQLAGIGRTTVVGEDDIWIYPNANLLRSRSVELPIVELVIGDRVRDYQIQQPPAVIYPYSDLGGDPVSELDGASQRVMWPFRHLLGMRTLFGKTLRERELPWWVHLEHYTDKLRTPLSIVFADVATHNHFVLDRGGKVFNRTAPVIKLPERVDEDTNLGLVGLLNSSTACFWMKQVFYPKGGDPVGRDGARVSAERWDDRYAHDGTKLKQFPLPAGRPLARAKRLDGLAQELSALLPERVLAEQAPSREALAEGKERADGIRAEMVAVQEELDWEVYRLYGLVDEELTIPVDALPFLHKGQRAFEVALARQVADGQATTSWFERHGSTPVTDLPEDWDPAYRKIVERRLELIEHDRAINLLERPEYKRRWHWPDWSQLEQEALRAWLCDRLEAPELWANPVLQTTARLASRRSVCDGSWSVHRARRRGLGSAHCRTGG